MQPLNQLVLKNRQFPRKDQRLMPGMFIFDEAYPVIKKYAVFFFFFKL